MYGKIRIDLELHDPHAAQDIIETLETVLPYMAQNVVVTSHWTADKED